MKIIPSNMERFLSFSVGRMQFIDSFQFAREGLGKLAENMRDEDLVYTQKAFPDPEQFQMMRKKGIFPYDLITSADMIKSKTPINFPTREQFYNSLTDESITEKQWQHGRNVFERYCPNRTLEEYHDLYLRCDVLLLADFFEKYRETCLTNYGLDSAHYFSAPGEILLPSNEQASSIFMASVGRLILNCVV